MAHHDIFAYVETSEIRTRHQEVGLVPDAVSGASLATAWRQHQQWRRALSLGDTSLVILSSRSRVYRHEATDAQAFPDVGELSTIT